MKAKTKRDLRMVLIPLVIGFVLGVWVAWPTPKKPAVTKTVQKMNNETDAWLGELDRLLAGNGNPDQPSNK
jgi:hypothetical protein